MQDPLSQNDSPWPPSGESPDPLLANAEGGLDLAPAAERDPRLRYGFRIGRYGFLSRPGLSGEVVVAPVIYRVPLAPPWLAGVLNQRGNIVPVFELSYLTEGAPHTPAAEPDAADRGERVVVVLGKGDEAVGLFADGLPRALAPAAEPPPSLGSSLPEVVADYIRPAFSRDGVVWMELDYAGLFRSLASRTSASIVGGAVSGVSGTMAEVVGG